MVRILLEYVLPIILPTAVYFAWLATERRRVARVGAGKAPHWRDAPWLWLAAIGLVFAVLIAVASALFGGSDIAGRYVPPRFEGGRIVPGHVEPKPQQ